jgi:aminopeptidase N
MPLIGLARCFWRPVQHDLLVPWAHRYLDEVAKLDHGGLLAQGSMVRAMVPATCDEAWLERAGEMAQDHDLPPMVRNQLTIAVDFLSRVLRARE